MEVGPLTKPIITSGKSPTVSAKKNTRKPGALNNPAKRLEKARQLESFYSKGNQNETPNIMTK